GRRRFPPEPRFLLGLSVFAFTPWTLVTQISRMLEELKSFLVALRDAFAVQVAVGEGEAGVGGTVVFAAADEERGRDSAEACDAGGVCGNERAGFVRGGGALALFGVFALVAAELGLLELFGGGGRRERWQLWDQAGGSKRKRGWKRRRDVGVGGGGRVRARARARRGRG
ncbi:MAG TPA: hypothetical protein VNN72_24530, partial [Polyangiaceae bacterium]|nr:hypothetical protein [Polyangiaceae bacterium]